MALGALRASALRRARELLEILFPVTCVGCGAYSPPTFEGPGTSDGSRQAEADRWLCGNCRAQIRYSRAACLACRAYSPTGRTCYACLPDTPLAGAVAVGPYQDPVLQAAIKRLKFSGIRSLAFPLGELLARRLAAAGLSPAVLVPLPLHPRKERERGFNQAQLLADVAGDLLGLPVVNLLVRTRPTSPQTSILESPRERNRNVAGAFAMRTPVPGYQPPERVMLVDDVLTTGATLTAAAHVLRNAGIADVWAAVIARG